MAGCGWISNVGSCRKITVFILKHTFQHEEFFATRMGMGRKLASGRISYNGSGARHLIAYAVQHATVDAFHGRGDPLLFACVDHGSLGEVRIELHRFFRFHCNGISSNMPVGGFPDKPA
jgi:hypothetical protein